ncbi:rhomboid-like intramembrane serine protease [Haloferax sp. BAB-2207]|nr:rhomboid-like intramembrane serine protease [Haloferax sp. BAB-2207]
MLEIPGWIPFQRLAALLALLAAAVALAVVDRPSRLSAALRRRFLFGLPLGTLASAGGVLLVYLVVQDGWSSWYRPVVIPFRAWSYVYPSGMLTAAFAHSSPGHLVGNLVGTLTLAPVAEYAWSHYPTRRGSTSFGSARENPYVRSLVVFPAVVFGVGLLTAVFALGPVVGFSGVVFAFAGFALVFRPLATVLAFVSGRVVSLFYNAMLSPEVVSSARPVFSTPWWSQIAIQGHAIGFLFGVLLGAWLSHRRGVRTARVPQFRRRPPVCRQRVAVGGVLVPRRRDLRAVPRGRVRARRRARDHRRADGRGVRQAASGVRTRQLAVFGPSLAGRPRRAPRRRRGAVGAGDAVQHVHRERRRLAGRERHGQGLRGDVRRGRAERADRRLRRRTVRRVDDDQHLGGHRQKRAARHLDDGRLDESAGVRRRVRGQSRRSRLARPGDGGPRRLRRHGRGGRLPGVPRRRRRGATGVRDRPGPGRTRRRPAERLGRADADGLRRAGVVRQRDRQGADADREHDDDARRDSVRPRELPRLR